MTFILRLILATAIFYLGRTISDTFTGGYLTACALILVSTLTRPAPVIEESKNE